MFYHILGNYNFAFYYTLCLSYTTHYHSLPILCFPVSIPIRMIDLILSVPSPLFFSSNYSSIRIICRSNSTSPSEIISLPPLCPQCPFCQKGRSWLAFRSHSTLSLRKKQVSWLFINTVPFLPERNKLTNISSPSYPFCQKGKS